MILAALWFYLVIGDGVLVPRVLEVQAGQRVEAHCLDKGGCCLEVENIVTKVRAQYQVPESTFLFHAHEGTIVRECSGEDRV